LQSELFEHNRPITDEEFDEKCQGSPLDDSVNDPDWKVDSSCSSINSCSLIKYIESLESKENPVQPADPAMETHITKDGTGLAITCNGILEGLVPGTVIDLLELSVPPVVKTTGKRMEYVRKAKRFKTLTQETGVSELGVLSTYDFTSSTADSQPSAICE